MESGIEKVYLGIHVQAERRPFTYCVLGQNLRLLTLEQGSLEEALAFASSDGMLTIGINAPAQLNAGLMSQSEWREQFTPPPPVGRWENLRVVEYQLHCLGLHIHRTDRKLEDCQGWLQKGLLFYRQLEEIGYQAYDGSATPKRWVETQTEAVFYQLLGQNLLEPDGVEGRIQRQLLLIECGLRVADPMEIFEEITRFKLLHGQFPFAQIMTRQKVNALAAAYMAWLAYNHPEKVKRIGPPEEGQIVIPVGRTH